MSRIVRKKTTKRSTAQPRGDVPIAGAPPELVILTGLSGSGKVSVLKILEDSGYYAVDNLPIDLIPTFARLCRQSQEISRAALVVDIRDGAFCSFTWRAAMKFCSGASAKRAVPTRWEPPATWSKTCKPSARRWRRSKD